MQLCHSFICFSHIYNLSQIRSRAAIMTVFNSFKLLSCKGFMAWNFGIDNILINTVVCLQLNQIRIWWIVILCWHMHMSFNNRWQSLDSAIVVVIILVPTMKIIIWTSEMNWNLSNHNDSPSFDWFRFVHLFRYFRFFATANDNLK